MCGGVNMWKMDLTRSLTLMYGVFVYTDNLPLCTTAAEATYTVSSHSLQATSMTHKRLVRISSQNFSTTDVVRWMGIGLVRVGWCIPVCCKRLMYRSFEIAPCSCLPPLCNLLRSRVPSQVATINDKICRRFRTPTIFSI